MVYIYHSFKSNVLYIHVCIVYGELSLSISIDEAEIWMPAVGSESSKGKHIYSQYNTDKEEEMMLSELFC